MGYTYKSEVTRNAPRFTEPLSENTLVRGSMFQEDLAQQSKQNFQANIDPIFNIRAMSPADEKILRQKQQELQDALGSINMSQLSNPQTKGQINSIINQFKNDPDILSVATRSAQISKEQKAKQEAEEKGLPYYSRALEEGNEYSNSGVYLRDKRFSNQGFVGVNLSKARNEALKEVPTEQYLGKDGFYHKRYNQKALEEGLNTFYADPRIKKQLLYDIEDKYRDRNWEDEAVNELMSYRDVAQSLGNQEDVAMYNQMLQDPQGYGEQIKQKTYNQELQDRINTDKLHSNFNSVEKASEYGLKAQELQKQKELEVYKMQLKTGVTPNKGESQAAYLQRLAQESQNRDLEIAQAKSDITQNRQESVEKLRQEGRMDVLEYKTNTGSIGIKGNKESKITIGDEQKDKATMIGDISRENKKVIQEVINQFPQSFGLNVSSDTAVDPEGLFDGGIWITEEEGVKYANYEANALIGGTKYKVPLSDVAKYIADPTHVPTVIDEDGNTVSGNKDYIDKSNVEDITESYVYGGYDYTREEIETAAKAQNKTFDEYLKSNNITKK